MVMPIRVRICRLAFGILAIVAVIRDFIDQLHRTTDFVPANFWSLFTNHSNLIAGVVLIGGALLPAHLVFSHRWDMARGGTVMFMTTTGVVYAALLGGIFNPLADDQTWMNSVLHQVTPIVMLLDLLLQPPATRIGFREALAWTIYPILFLVYSLARGPVVDWYPYSFLNPNEVGGYVGVGAYSLAITTGFLLMTTLVVGLSHIAGRRIAPLPADGAALA